jgi:multiple antibiotic resistance protein
MHEWTEYTKFIIGLLAIVDPFLSIPIFLSITEGQSTAEKTKTVRTITLTVTSVLLISAFTGAAVLHLMGTSLASFRVGGGLIILLMALSMLHAQAGSLRQTPEERRELESGGVSGVVPLGIPLLAGPGAISTVILAMNRAVNWYQKGIVISCILIVCAIMWIVLRLAEPIGSALGRIGLNVISRLLGLVLAAIAIEIMANGLKELFPALSQMH